MACIGVLCLESLEGNQESCKPLKDPFRNLCLDISRNTLKMHVCHSYTIENFYSIMHNINCILCGLRRILMKYIYINHTM